MWHVRTPSEHWTGLQTTDYACLVFIQSNELQQTVVAFARVAIYNSRVGLMPRTRKENTAVEWLSLHTSLQMFAMFGLLDEARESNLWTSSLCISGLGWWRNQCDNWECSEILCVADFFFRPYIQLSDCQWLFSLPSELILIWDCLQCRIWVILQNCYVSV